jgi:uncharacterized protein
MTRVLALLLAPGAGADRNQSSLVAIDSALTASGVMVRRMDFPYRKAGRRAPDRQPVLLRAVVEEAQELAAVAGCPPAALALGGRSMGGRMCSIAVAEGLPAAALVLISYPLHPPGRPDRMRTEHFPQLTIPCLFLSGTRDAFGSPEELTRAAAAIPGPVTHGWIEGKDHGLRGCDADVAAEVRSFVMGLGPQD